MPEWMHLRAEHITAKTAGAAILPDDRPMWTSPVGGPVTKAERDLKEHQEGVDTSISKGADFSPAVTWDGTVRGGAKQVSPAPPFNFRKMAKEHKLQGHLVFQGIPIAIENRKGSVRSGVAKDGKPWRTEMKVPYGYIKGTRGADGEEVDAFVGSNKKAPSAFVVHQRQENGKGYDEDKVMLGFGSKDEAVKTYLEHYDNKKFLGPVKEVPLERLKKLMDEGKPMKKIALNLPSMGSLRSGLNAAAGKLSPTLAKPVGQVAQQAAGAVKNEATGLAHSVSAALPHDMSHVTPGHFAEGVGKHLMSKLPTASSPMAQRVAGIVPKVLNAGANFALGVPKLADFDKQACLDELAKLGAISDEQAAKALERYESLEKNEVTPSRVARYGVLGAVTAPAMSAVSGLVGGQPLFGGGSLKKRLRGAAGAAVGGAIGMGALPLVRQHLDRRAEMGTLKSYMAQPHLEQERSIHTAGKLSAPFEAAEKTAGLDDLKADLAYLLPQTRIEAQLAGGLLGVGLGGVAGYLAGPPVLKAVLKALHKTAFNTNEYSGPMGPVFFRQHSGVPPMKVPGLRSAVEAPAGGNIVTKLGSGATTAAGRLASSMKIGLPKVTAPAGPSIAQVAKPVGFGRPLAGANKGTI